MELRLHILQPVPLRTAAICLSVHRVRGILRPSQGPDGSRPRDVYSTHASRHSRPRHDLCHFCTYR